MVSYRCNTISMHAHILHTLVMVMHKMITIIVSQITHIINDNCQMLGAVFGSDLHLNKWGQ